MIDGKVTAGHVEWGKQAATEDREGLAPEQARTASPSSQHRAPQTLFLPK